ncbi:hypothetical protein XPA_009921 [Xanthoria parietina]
MVLYEGREASSRLSGGRFHKYGLESVPQISLGQFRTGGKLRAQSGPGTGPGENLDQPVAMAAVAFTSPSSQPATVNTW